MLRLKVGKEIYLLIFAVRKYAREEQSPGLKESWCGAIIEKGCRRLAEGEASPFMFAKQNHLVARKLTSGFERIVFLLELGKNKAHFCQLFRLDLREVFKVAQVVCGLLDVSFSARVKQCPRAHLFVGDL